MRKLILALSTLVLTSLACNLLPSIAQSDYTNFGDCINRRVEEIGPSVNENNRYDDEVLPSCLAGFPTEQHEDLLEFERTCSRGFSCSGEEFEATQTQAAVTATEQALETEMAVATMEAAQAESEAENADPAENPEPEDDPTDGENPPGSGEPSAAGAPDLDTFCEIYQEMLDDNARRVEAYIDAIKVEGSDLPDQIAVEADLALDAYFDRLVVVAPDEIRSEVETIAAGSLLGLQSSPDGVPALEGHLETVSTYAHENCDLILPEAEE